MRGLDALLVNVFAVVKVLRDLRDWKGCTGRQSWPEKRLLWLDSVVVPALEMTISSLHAFLQEQALEAVMGIRRRGTYGLSGTSRCPRRIHSRREKQPDSRSGSSRALVHCRRSVRLARLIRAIACEGSLTVHGTRSAAAAEALALALTLLLALLLALVLTLTLLVLAVGLYVACDWCQSSER